MRMRTLAILWLLVALVLTGCGQTEQAEPKLQADSVAELAPNTDISVQQLHQILQQRDVYLLDVRTPKEYESAHLANTDNLIGYNAIGDHLSALPEAKDTEIIVYCRTGRRSRIASDFLRQAGYANIRDVLGGITAWQKAGYAVERGAE